MRYAGILEPLLESAQKRLPANAASLIGQPVVLPHSKGEAFICVDWQKNLHFLLTPAAQDPEIFTRFKLRAMAIENRTWNVANQQTSTYLDIMCLVSQYPSLQRPFLSFCEDILADLEDSADPETATLRCCRRWRRFWTEDRSEEFSLEWLYGILGELTFLRALIEDLGPSTVGAWTGPEARDHDFQVDALVAFEIKTGASIPFVINCNLNQLDNKIFPKLYLVCFLIEASETGVTLPRLVRSIEDALEGYEDAADLFYTLLIQSGYRRHLEPLYSRHVLSITGPDYYRVDESFPSLTVNSFREPLDSRIWDVRYKLELSGLSSLTQDNAEIREHRALLRR